MSEKKIYLHHERDTLVGALADIQNREIVYTSDIEYLLFKEAGGEDRYVLTMSTNAISESGGTVGIASLDINSSTVVNGVLDEDTLGSDSATKLATQQSIKAYVDAQITGADEWSRAGTDTYLTNSGDNVGLGISSPDGKLHIFTSDSTTVGVASGADDLIIESAGTTGMSLFSPDASTASIAFGSPTDYFAAVLRWNYNALLMRIGTAASGGEVAFESGNAVEAMRIDSSGQVGIGTTSPDSLLHIEDDVASLSTLARIVNTDYSAASGTRLSFRGGYDASTTQYLGHLDFIKEGVWSATASTQDSAFALHLRKNGADAEVLNITSDGDVGIGTSSPGEALDVAGLVTINTRAQAANPRIYFRQDTVSASNYIQVDRASGEMEFWVNATQALAIDTSAVATFANFPVTPSSAPSTDYQVANKKYVDDQITGSNEWTRAGTDTYLTNSGDNVGIGTSSPVTKLQVENDASSFIANSDGTLLVRETATGIPSAIVLRSVADNAGDGNKGAVIFDAGALGTTADNKLALSARLQDAADYDFVLTGAGKVGIGTDSPEAKLNVYLGSGGALTPQTGLGLIIESDQSTGLQILTPDAANSNIWLGSAVDSTASLISWRGDTATFQMGTTTPTGITKITSGNNAAAITIDADGDVGIGTDSPGSLLDVAGTTSIDTRAQAANPRLVLKHDSVSANNYIQVDRSSGNMELWVNGGERVSIDTSGNVGIGTASPDSLLHIEDDAASLSTLARIVNADYSAASGTRLSFRGGYDASNTQYLGHLDFVKEGVWSATTSTQDSAFVLNLRKNGANAEVLNITSDGNVGVGNTPVNNRFVVANDGGDVFMSVIDTAVNEFVFGTVDGSNVLSIGKQSDKTQLNLDASGNLGLGANPVNTSAGLVFAVSDAKPTILLEDTDVVAGTVGRTQYLQNQGGSLYFYRSAVSGGATSGSELSMTVQADGKVGIGTDLPDTLLHVLSASSGAFTVDTGADDLFVENNTDCGITIGCPDADTGSLIIGSPTDEDFFKLSASYDGDSVTMTLADAVFLEADSGVSGDCTIGFASTSTTTFINGGTAIMAATAVGINDTDPNANLTINTGAATGLIQNYKSDTTHAVTNFDGITIQTDDIGFVKENINAKGGLYIGSITNSTAAANDGVIIASCMPPVSSTVAITLRALQDDGAGGTEPFADWFLSVDDGTESVFYINNNGSSQVEFSFGYETTGGDVYMTFWGAATNQGVFVWRDLTDVFDFLNEIQMSGTEKISFNDSEVYINSANDGYLDFTADTAVRFNSTALADTATKFTFRDSAIGIYSQADTFLDLFADGAVRIGDSSSGVPSTYMAVEPDGGTYWFGGGSGIPYAEIYGRDVTATITISSSGIANKVQVTSFDANGFSNLCTPDHTNDHITIVKAGKYKVDVSISFSSTGGTAYIMSFGVFKNNGVSSLLNSHCTRSLSGGGSDYGVAAITGIFNASASDTIELWCWNETNTNNVVVESVTMDIIQLGG